MAQPESKTSNLIPKSIYLTTVGKEELTSEVFEQLQNSCAVIRFPRIKHILSASQLTSTFNPTVTLAELKK